MTFVFGRGSYNLDDIIYIIKNNPFHSRLAIINSKNKVMEPIQNNYQRSHAFSWLFLPSALAKWIAIKYFDDFYLYKLDVDVKLPNKEFKQSITQKLVQFWEKHGESIKIEHAKHQKTLFGALVRPSLIAIPIMYFFYYNNQKYIDAATIIFVVFVIYSIVSLKRKFSSYWMISRAVHEMESRID